MASDSDIANFALLRLGAAPILSLDDNVERARVMKTLYPVVRDAELTTHNWLFAMTRAKLAAVTTAPSWGYTNAFELPTDYLSIVQVGETVPGLNLQDYRNTRQSDYRLEGHQVLTDLGAPLSILYTRQVPDPSQFDALFVLALGYKLALEACEKLTQSNTKIQILDAGYKDAIIKAIRNDSIQQSSEAIADDTWIMVRT